MKKSKRDPKDKYILFMFLAFFGTVFILDSIFVYIAVSTQPGVVTERAYERGLDYNKTLEQAKNQPNLNDAITFENGILRWNSGDNTLNSAIVTARIIRPVQGGYDFDITLGYQGDGAYEAPLHLPLKGKWEAKLESKWNDQIYKTTHQLMMK